MPVDLAAADPLAALLTVLKDHPTTADLLGGPEHVSGLLEAPWPHLVVGNGPGGDLRDLTWSMEHGIDFELYGHPEGYPGKAALWRTAVSILAAVVAIPETYDAGPGEPVMSRVRPSGTFTWAPTTAGQPRYVFGALVVIRPPTT